jgi:hypothetical protein
MISPLGKPFDPRVLLHSAPNSPPDRPAAERESTNGSGRPPLRTVDASRTVGDDDVRRFEAARYALQDSLTVGGSEPSFRMSEDALARLEAGLRAQEKKVPRASQLPPVVGLAALGREGSSPEREGSSPEREGSSPEREGSSPEREGSSPEREGSRESSRETFERGSFQPAPPLASERLQVYAPKQRRSNLDVPLLGLIAGTVTVAVAFYFSTTGATPELVSVKGVPVELSPKLIAQPIETEAKNQTSGEQTNRDKLALPGEAGSTLSTVSAASIESATSSSSTTVSPRSHVRRVRHPGNSVRPKS